MTKTVQFINDDSGPAFAVMPIDEYRRLLAASDVSNLSDEEVFDRAIAKNEESFPAEITRKLVAGENPIRVFRKHRGLTQGELAEKVSSTSTYISQLETGVRSGSVDLLKSIAAALDVDLDSLA